MAETDVGELTLQCDHCGDKFTYVKTSGPRRRFCTRRCGLQSAHAKRMARAEHAEHPTRRCSCGSANVARVGKPVCADCRKWRGDSEKRREYERDRRLALYGLEQVSFDELLTVQRGCCAICATDDPGPRGWHIDHDHACCPGVGSCGECVRGILCHHCNLLLGNAKDSIERLDHAKRYLQIHSRPAGLRVVKHVG